MPAVLEAVLSSVAHAVEAASRGRARQAAGVVLAPVAAAAAYVIAWETVFLFEGRGPLSLVAQALAGVALWFAFIPLVGWTFLMLSFLIAGRRWSSVVAAPVLYLGLGLVYVLGGPILAGFDFGYRGILLMSLMWPVLFAWAELGCGLGLGLCPN